MRTYRKEVYLGLRDEPELNDAIDRLYASMATADPESDEYTSLLTNLERLYALRSGHRLKKVSPDTVLLVGGNIVAILIIVAAEQGHVLTSKALSFLKFK